MPLYMYNMTQMKQSKENNVTQEVYLFAIFLKCS